MFFHIPSTSVLTVGPGCSLMAARWCRSSPVVPWRAGIADDCDILVHWCGRKHSISHMGNPMDRRTWWATVHGVARVEHNLAAAAAAAKSLQSCPTLCDPIDGSQPGSPIPGILQARVLEWAAISFPMHESEKWKWNCSAVSDSSRPHGLQSTRLLRPWDFPGKSTGVGCHCLLRT